MSAAIFRHLSRLKMPLLALLIATRLLCAGEVVAAAAARGSPKPPQTSTNPGLLTVWPGIPGEVSAPTKYARNYYASKFSVQLCAGVVASSALHRWGYRFRRRQQQQAQIIEGMFMAQATEEQSLWCKVNQLALNHVMNTINQLRTRVQNQHPALCTPQQHLRIADTILLIKLLTTGRAAQLYGLDNCNSIEGAFWAHQQWQTTALKQAATAGAPPAVVAKLHGHVGLGNRLPTIVTGYLMALMPGRVFLLQLSPQFTDYFKLGLPSDWSQYGSLYSNASNCTVSKHQQLASKGPMFCSSNVSDATVVMYASYDYDVPLLQVNPTLAPYFKQLLPDGEVFHHVSKLLLQPTDRVKRGMLPYQAQASKCLVGIHLRHNKAAHLNTDELHHEQFARIAQSLSQGQDHGSIFVASDKDVFKEVASLLRDREVWWNNASQSEVSKHRTVAGNPGTELGAIVDLLLLSGCKQIIVTPGSSFGCVAAALGGVKPVYATYGSHSTPFLNPWFWQSVTSEPCMCKLAPRLQATLGSALDLLKTKHPLYYFHSQCHP